MQKSLVLYNGDSGIWDVNQDIRIPLNLFWTDEIKFQIFSTTSQSYHFLRNWHDYQNYKYLVKDTSIPLLCN